MFCDELGGRFHPQRLTDWFAKHRKAAEKPTGTLHVLRHTAATLMLTAWHPGSYRRGEAQRRSENGALDVRAPAPAV